MSTNDSFDRQFRRTARSLRRQPAPRTWDRIEQRLDRRGRPGARFFGLRPWLIAAAVLLLAGVAVFVQLPAHTASGPSLAQRAESVEELPAVEITLPRIPDYQPVAEGSADRQVIGRGEPVARLVAAPKYRL